MKIRILTIISCLIVLTVGWGILASYKKSTPTVIPIVNTPAPVPTPQPPTELKVLPVSDTQANLSWLVPADNTGIVGYMVYRDDQKIGTTLNPIYSDSTYSSSIVHSYKVASYNSQGMQSVFSNVAIVPKKTVGVIKPPPAPAPTPTPVPPPAPAPTPTPVPPPPPPPAAACGSGGACTAAEVGLHHTQADCWVYLSPVNKVYNITGFVANPNTHPGGNVIIPHCGSNIYDYFLGNAGGHRHSNFALNTVLQSYYIAPFQ